MRHNQPSGYGAAHPKSFSHAASLFHPGDESRGRDHAYAGQRPMHDPELHTRPVAIYGAPGLGFTPMPIGMEQSGGLGWSPKITGYNIDEIADNLSTPWYLGPWYLTMGALYPGLEDWWRGALTQAEGILQWMRNFSEEHPDPMGVETYRKMLNVLGQLSQYIGGVTDRDDAITTEVSENIPGLTKYRDNQIGQLTQLRKQLEGDSMAAGFRLQPESEPDMGERIGETLKKFAPEIKVGIAGGGTVAVVGGLGVAAFGMFRKSTPMILGGLALAVFGGVAAGAAGK